MKHILILLFSTIPILGLSQEIQITDSSFHHCFYPENSFTVGLGATYSFKLDGVGINVKAYYNVGEKWCFGPEFSYVKNKETTLYDVSMIAHYIIESNLVGMYPVFGINYSKEENTHETVGGFGIVIGGGIHRNFNKLTVFAEYAHVESILQDDFVSLGLMRNIP
jgi:hypothetical protein